MEKLRLSDYIHRAWMNGRRFEQKGNMFEVVEGKYNYIRGELVPTVVFENVRSRQKFEMSEKEFFYKVQIIDLCNTK